MNWVKVFGFLFFWIIHLVIYGQQLQVEGALQIDSDRPTINLYDNSKDRLMLEIGAISDDEIKIWSKYGALRIGTGSNGFASTKLFVKTDGDVGIGTLTPLTRLHLKDNGEILRLEGTNTEYISFFDGSFRDGEIGFGVNEIHDLVIRNYNKGFEDLIVLHGGNGGKLWMYPDGKLYANNLVI